MNDILPPKKRPLNPQMVQLPVSAPQPASPTISLEEVAPVLSGSQSSKSKRTRRTWIWTLLCGLGLIAVILGGAVMWYKLSLRPVDAKDTSHSRITITAGMSPSEIGFLLQKDKLIRSSYAFDIYTRLSNTRSKLQAGVYALSP